jgi:hypothetical protein
MTQRELDLREARLVFETYQKVKQHCLDTLSNVLVSPDDIDEELGYLTTSVVKSIMRLLGYKEECDFAFETVLFALDDGDDFNFILKLLYGFGYCCEREEE